MVPGHSSCHRNGVSGVRLGLQTPLPRPQFWSMLPLSFWVGLRLELDTQETGL